MKTKYSLLMVLLQVWSGTAKCGTAETRNQKLVSADHHELDSLEADGLI